MMTVLRCNDNEGQMRIHCAFALHDGGIETQPFEVSFAKQSTALYLSCSQVQISVQSVRWPANRFTASNGRDLRESCVGRGTCSRVDALIWVSPLCSSEQSMSLACIPMFTQASCYPYCMAARLSAAASEDLILHSAADWEGSVLVADRDCAVQALLADASTLSTCAGDGTCSMQILDPSPDVLLTRYPQNVIQSYVQRSKWDLQDGCTLVDKASTMIPKERLTDEVSLGYRSVLLAEQPFAYAGDTTLTAVRSGSGSMFVQVTHFFS